MAIEHKLQTLTAHLTVSDAAAAIEFYKKALGAVEEGVHMMPDSKKVMHATLVIGDSKLMLNDEFPEMGAAAPTSPGGGASSIVIHLNVPDVDAGFKRAIDAGATSVMPVEDMFWGDRYGRFKDPFGFDWSIATPIRSMTSEEIEAASRKAMSAT